MRWIRRDVRYIPNYFKAYYLILLSEKALYYQKIVEPIVHLAAPRAANRFMAFISVIFSRYRTLAMHCMLLQNEL